MHLGFTYIKFILYTLCWAHRIYNDIQTGIAISTFNGLIIDRFSTKGKKRFE